MTEAIATVRDCICYKFKSGLFHLVPKDCSSLFPLSRRLALFLRSLRGYTCYYLKSKEDVLAYCFIKHNYLHKYAFMRRGDLLVNPYFTLPKYRGCGYATALVRAAITDLPSDAHIWAVVAKDNAPSFAVLQKVGFQWVGYCSGGGALGRLKCLNNRLFDQS